MDRAYVAENDKERARLKSLVAALSDEELGHPVSARWTVGVALMHLAFWDRLWLAKFEEWERTGTVQMPQIGDAVNGMNDGMLPWWRAVAPAQVRHEVMACRRGGGQQGGHPVRLHGRGCHAGASANAGSCHSPARSPGQGGARHCRTAAAITPTRRGARSNRAPHNLTGRTAANTPGAPRSSRPTTAGPR